MCLCTTPYAVCKPTERALTLGRLLYWIMFILLGLVILGFLGGYYQLAILSIFLIVTGWCGVRSNEAYNIEQILCVTFFSGYILVYTVVDLILKIVYAVDPTVDGVEIPKAALISLFGGVVFYSAACIIAKLLYDELRANYQHMADPGFQRPSFLNRMMGTQNQAQQVPDQPSAEEIPLVNNNGRGRALGGGQRQEAKFQAFSGQAHSMDDR